MKTLEMILIPHIVGPQCQFCQPGYFGTATNGGNCTSCECNDQASLCDAENGVCFCNTRGVVGDKCDKYVELS